MPLNFIRLTKFLLTALVAGQTLHLSLSKAAPTPDLTSVTSVVARDPVIDSESTQSSIFNSLSIHGGVACSQCGSDSISEGGNPVLNRRKVITTVRGLTTTIHNFQRISTTNPVNLINTLVTNLDEVDQVVRDPEIPYEQLKYTANQYRAAYLGFLEKWLESKKAISLTPAIKLVIILSKGIQNQLGSEDRDKCIHLLYLLSTTPGMDAGSGKNKSFVQKVMEGFIQIQYVSGDTERNSRVEAQIKKLTKDASEKTGDDKAVADAFLVLYHDHVT